MPLYEYICEADGEVIELLRPASSADDPVQDPAGRGRTFIRVHSTFASRAGRSASSGASGDVSLGQSHACRCGKGSACGH
ncbi:MAG: zinc ribbon domain-containing protein [Phycisphaerales bacterium]|nr:zinc ribbon domain-containing protein [Phycisphaerales bacterium]